MGRIVVLSALLLCAWPAAVLGQSLPPGQPDLTPRRGSDAAPELPRLEPTLPPPSTVGPAPAARSAPNKPLSTAPIFVLRGIKLEGNTVLGQAAIDKIVAPHIGKPASIASLDEIRRALTLLYVNRGYINSGVVIPDQNVTQGVITFRAVEGKVTEVDISGTRHFKPEYLRSRLERGLTTPFEIADLQREQQILLEDPLVTRLNLELRPGLVPGEAKLHAEVAEGSPYSITAQIANNQSPTVGEIRGQVAGAVANLWGVGDILAAQYGRSSGINDGAVAYSLPLASDDTRLSLRYDINGTVVVTPALSSLDITSNYDSIALGISRPFYRTAQSALTLGASLERREAQTFLLGTPFSFTAGSSNGKTNVTVVRIYQDWLERDAEHALALRSTFSVGVHALGATVTAMPPTGEFFAWLGQAQYVRRVYKDWEAVVRSDLQLANGPLFPIEQFALGGIDSVRGYRQYLTVSDDAFFASGELRIPIASLRLPHLADNEEAGKLSIVPFYDYGRGWDVGRPTPYPADISGVGAGLRWDVGSGILAELYYAKPLRKVSAGTSLEDRGIYFRLTTKLY
jgi:hemolysin activation/secretion protein